MTATTLSPAHVTDTPIERLWTTTDVCAYLRWTAKHLRDVRRDDPTFPQPIMLGARSHRWHRAELEDWLNRQPRAPRPSVEDDGTGIDQWAA
ncbi:AlpA family phage regulatory protein [Acidimicrobiia bacterium EGI L10123]|uniref:helix-turn-helix transcriptional regulator n=1 Tax=Salinilacustrithrix flava TaxID=2957203 RepID=UPI003D7C275F|nr:AlpA family phage regulatory protein [Acidimicrobiia bacterium EGI L10123]